MSEFHVRLVQSMFCATKGNTESERLRESRKVPSAHKILGQLMKTEKADHEPYDHIQRYGTDL